MDYQAQVAQLLQHLDDATALELVGVGFRGLVIHTWTHLTHEVLSHNSKEGSHHGLRLCWQAIGLGELKQDSIGGRLVCSPLVQDLDGSLDGIHTLTKIGGLLNVGLVVFLALSISLLLLRFSISNIALK